MSDVVYYIVFKGLHYKVVSHTLTNIPPHIFISSRSCSSSSRSNTNDNCLLH